MKTTIDIPDALLDEVRRVASREGTSVKTLVEQGLRQVISERNRHRPFRLRKASFKGRGLGAEAKRAGWKRLRELAYEEEANRAVGLRRE